MSAPEHTVLMTKTGFRHYCQIHGCDYVSLPCGIDHADHCDGCAAWITHCNGHTAAKTEPEVDCFFPREDHDHALCVKALAALPRVDAWIKSVR